MKKTMKFDTFLIGFITGIVLPPAVALIIFLFTSKGLTILDYYFEILKRGFMTHGLSLCVVPDIILFFVFNRADMLKSARGMLGATIVWLLVIVLNKFFAG